MEEINFSNGTKAIPTNLEDCYIIEPKVFGDNRGYFCPYFLKEYMKYLGFKRVVQTNRSMSSKNVLRGLHFQKRPYAQAKIVEVISGKAVDVVVDIRKGSPTYGESTSVLLTPYDANIENSGRQLFVPRGFAHGFISLEDNTTFQYLVDNKYKPKSEGGILWRDEVVRDLWEYIFVCYDIDFNELILSDKDEIRPSLDESPTYFKYKKRLLTPSKNIIKRRI